MFVCENLSFEYECKEDICEVCSLTVTYSGTHRGLIVVPDGVVLTPDECMDLLEFQSKKKKIMVDNDDSNSHVIVTIPVPFTKHVLKGELDLIPVVGDVKEAILNLMKENKELHDRVVKSEEKMEYMNGTITQLVRDFDDMKRNFVLLRDNNLTLQYQNDKLCDQLCNEVEILKITSEDNITRSMWVRDGFTYTDYLMFTTNKTVYGYSFEEALVEKSKHIPISQLVTYMSVYISSYCRGSSSYKIERKGCSNVCELLTNAVRNSLLNTKKSDINEVAGRALCAGIMSVVGQVPTFSKSLNLTIGKFNRGFLEQLHGYCGNNPKNVIREAEKLGVV